MVRRTGARKLALMVAAVVGVSTLNLSTSSADVTAVKGSAYGVFASVSLFGGPPNVAGPAPAVTLPPTGSAVPITANAPTTSVQFGPAILFTSGPAAVSTQGTLGPNGSVSSSSSLTNINTSGVEIFTAGGIASSCTASESGVSGSTTITNGVIILQDPNPDTVGENGEVRQVVPTNPAPNTTYNGTVPNVNDNFQAIFNEQTINADGSITVYAYHLRLLGPTAVGDLYAGKSECGVTAVPSSTTTSSTTSSTTTSTSSTSTTSTTVPTTTSTSTTSTTVPTTTSTSTTSTTVPTTTSTSTTSTTVPTTTSTSTTSTTVPTTTSSTTTTSTTVPTTTSSTTTTTSSTTTTTIQPTTTTTVPSTTCARLQAQKAAFNAQITALQASLAQSLSGEQLAAAIAQLEAARAAGNAQYDEAIALCGATSPTSTTSVPTTTTTTPPPTDAEICATLLQQASNPFVAPFIQQLLVQYGCI